VEYVETTLEPLKMTQDLHLVASKQMRAEIKFKYKNLILPSEFLKIERAA